MVDIQGREKIVNYINRYKVRKIKLSRGSDVVYMKTIKDNESQSDLIEDFSTWIDDFIDENNFKEYKLELLGSNNTDPDARLSTIVKISVAFNGKPDVSLQRTSIGATTGPISVNDYVNMAVENAELKAQLGNLESKVNELLLDENDDDDLQESDTMGTIRDILLSKMDGIVDVLIHQFGSGKLTQTPSQGISGTDTDELTDWDVLYNEFIVINPHIVSDLNKLLELAKTKPQIFNMLLAQLRNM